MKIIVGLLFVAVMGVSALAQQDARVVAELNGSTDKIVKGSPFSADAISESVQTLADGNRIVHSSTTKMFRNSEGRFRRDISDSVGNAGGANYNVGYSTTILDPVGGARYTFNDKEKVARQYTLRVPTPAVRIAPTSGAMGQGGVMSTASQAEREKAIVALKTRLDGSSETATTGPSTAVAHSLDAQKLAEIDRVSSINRIVTTDGQALSADQMMAIEKATANLRAATPAPPVAVQGGVSGAMLIPSIAAPVAGGMGGGMTVISADGVKSRYETHTDKLGTQNFEGVDAEGTRTTTTIPAGAIGNDRPIEIVYESWYSKDLQLTVYSRRSDPRTGEQIYRLTNISRSEPDSSVFAVPSGYRIVSQTTPGVYTVAPPKKTATPQTEAKAAQQPTPGTTRARP